MAANDIIMAAAGGSTAANYIENVFSTYLYTGTGASQTITNGIDLSTKGGLVWIKSRSAATNHNLFDTAQGATKLLHSNTTAATVTDANSLTSFNTTGFTLGSGSTAGNQVNVNTATYVSWAFRKQPKFFDVETYTGNGGTLSVSHALGSKPGCIIIKSINPSSDWLVITRKSDGNIYAMYLNSTIGQFYDGTEGSLWTSTSVSIDWLTSNVSGGYNDNGTQYVMYLFAHNAGGFGAAGTDNVISCGSFVTDGSGIGTANLGYEPQWVLTKKVNGSGNWQITDVMRAWTNPAANAVLFSNLTNAETSPTGSSNGAPNATGFTWEVGVSAQTYIYIAIRRGPMKVPTSGTSVFSPNAVSTDASAVTTNFPVDLSFESPRSGSSNIFAQDRLRGANKILYTYNTDAESTAGGSASNFQSNTSVQPSIYGSGTSLIFWNFQRAPSFFDEVCYTGTGVARTVTHNLGVVPELMIVKCRSQAGNFWSVYNSFNGATDVMYLSATYGSFADSSSWNNTAPTSSVFTVNNNGSVNDNNQTYVAYLFATCAGVSKVGNYSGTGSTQTISCGFTGGARFVLIKRTDTNGYGWYVWDTARGMVSGTDPSLLLNSTAAEVNANSIYTTTGGFQIVSTDAGINASGGSYIFLAVA